MKMDRHVNFRIPKSVHAAIAAMATDAGETLSEAFRKTIERGLRDSACREERAH
jgi:predicted HicB family RNase H-like nuclease